MSDLDASNKDRGKEARGNEASGTGGPPVCAVGGSPASQPSSESFIPFNAFDPARPVRITKRNLPHWRQLGATYFVTFRLADAVPAGVVQEWKHERDVWLRHHPQPWDGKTTGEYHARFWQKHEEWFDQGHGACVLRQPAVAQVVAGCLRRFHGERYVLDAFVIMPNHVHALVKPLPGHELTETLHTWKGYTSKKINPMLGTTGKLWMDESHDHIVRDWAELCFYRGYIKANPASAGLRDDACVLGGEHGLRQPGSDVVPGEPPGAHTGGPPVPRLQIPAFELCEIGDHDGWRKLPGDVVYAGPYVQVEECRFLTPARPDTPVKWTVAHRKSAVAVAPVTEDGRFVLIHQERLPVRRALWEFPAGQLDDGETREAIVDTVFRELDEEAGVEPVADATVTPLGWFFGSQGFTSEHVYLFAVGPVRIVRAPQPVGGEHIGEVRLVTAAELRQMVASHIIQDALTLALFARMAALGMV